LTYSKPNFIINLISKYSIISSHLTQRHPLLVLTLHLSNFHIKVHEFDFTFNILKSAFVILVLPLISVLFSG